MDEPSWRHVRNRHTEASPTIACHQEAAVRDKHCVIFIANDFHEGVLANANLKPPAACQPLPHQRFRSTTCKDNYKTEKLLNLIDK
jgi:hypothetical protein